MACSAHGAETKLKQPKKTKNNISGTLGSEARGPGLRNNCFFLFFKFGVRPCLRKCAMLPTRVIDTCFFCEPWLLCAAAGSRLVQAQARYLRNSGAGRLLRQGRLGRGLLQHRLLDNPGRGTLVRANLRLWKPGLQATARGRLSCEVVAALAINKYQKLVAQAPHRVQHTRVPAKPRKNLLAHRRVNPFDPHLEPPHCERRVLAGGHAGANLRLQLPALDTLAHFADYAGGSPK